MQRFDFALELPATTRRQQFILRLRVRTGDADPWLPLPGVTLEAVPETWRASLKTLADRVSCGRLAAQEKLGRVLAQSEARLQVAADASAAEGPVQIWFLEDEPDQPAGETPQAVRVVFKAGTPGGVVVKRIGTPPTATILVDAGILNTLETDPAAQEVFELVLTTAGSLVPPPNPQN